MVPEAEPTSLYVHVPFCVRKCAYCDFYSVATDDAQLMGAYLRAVGLEAERSAALPPLRTVYVGGGTPTALPAPMLAELFVVLRRRFDLSRVDEFTVEANPGTLTDEHVAVLLAAGVGRVSLGVQSMDTDALRILGRIHGPDDVRESADMLRREADGVELSVDLMFGLPGQTLEACLADVEAGIQLDPDHVSAYGLSVEPGTPLAASVASGDLRVIDDGLYAEMVLAVHDLLERSGFEHYEISNYALPGRRCEHNMVYWRNEPYLGLGPAAASYVGGRRWTNVADVAGYIDRLSAEESPVAYEERLSPEGRARETAMLNLRTAEGIPVGSFRAATGLDPLELFAEAITRHGPPGLIEVTSGLQASIRLTRAALPVADAVLADFVA